MKRTALIRLVNLPTKNRNDQVRFGLEEQIVQFLTVMLSELQLSSLAAILQPRINN